MKRMLAFALTFALVFMLAGCRHAEKAKKEIFNLVEENYEVIREACQEKDTDVLCEMDGIETVDIVDGYVLVYCQGYGIVPSSQYYGFYYSEENVPVAVFDCQIVCDTKELVKEGNGHQYVDAGYNVFYTEQIKGNIYFYSASF